ncbi:MAG: peptide chain release factor N(5)-glutamine methyltransferase [Candidatus Saccharibacteria bacterium]|nr:peptide chain release factor N(5)-glutamine methyltransferase [Candidatus Saccharibacteria bacterium]
MNVSSWLTAAKTKLDPVDAELIILNILHDEIDRPWLVSHNDYILSESEQQRADEDLNRRMAGEPLAYIRGYKYFYGRKFLVDNSVLIPRPETEDLIDFVLGLKPQKILDVGTGSGCIAVTLALELPQAKVVASDIHQPTVAIKNAEQLNARVDFVVSDLMDDINGNFDVIVANLPYVDKNWDWIDDSLKFEPDEALYADDGGLYLIKKLILQIKGRTKYLILEADTSQHPDIIKFAKGCGLELVHDRRFAICFRY